MKNNFQLSKLAASLAVMGGMSLFSGQLMAAAPLAGASISNVATASYTDATGSERTVTSNLVKTLIAQVGGFTFVADREGQTAANSNISFSHILTNTGNGTDTFKLELKNLNPNGSAFDFTEIKVYLDKNQDGIPDSNIPIITYGISGSVTTTAIQLEANESTGILIVAKTPATAIVDQLDQLSLTATSVGYSSSTPAVTNTDTAYIKTGAIVQIEKSANVSASVVGSNISYTLKFNNKGTAETVDPVTIYDILPKNLELVSVVYNSVTYNLASVASVYQYGMKTTGEEVFLLNVGKLSAGQSGQITLNVRVKAKVGTTDVVDGEKIINTAYVDTDSKTTDGTNPLTPNNVPLTPPSTATDKTIVPSNPNTVTVTGIFSSSINDSKTNAWKDDGVNKPSEADDIVNTTAKQGTAIVFGGATAGENDKIYIHNSGNTADSYNLSLDKTAFGNDSIVEFLQSDGKTPLISNNTGFIAPGATLEIVVQVTLASGQKLIIPAASYLEAILTSTSVKNIGNKDTIKLHLTAFNKSEVDLIHKPIAGGEKGTGTNNSTDVPSTTIQPGKPNQIDITIKNIGSTADNYIISLPTIPEGWTVDVFKKVGGVCSNEKVPNSGNIAAGSEVSFCLSITPPADTPATDTLNPIKIPVNIQSPSTGVSDTIEYPVVVDQVRALKLTQDRSGQVAVGGSIIYTHTLTNYGNVTEGLDTTSALNFALSGASVKGEIVTLYVDSNNDGVIDPVNELWNGTNLDALLKDTKASNGLSPRESVTIFVKIEASKTAAVGDSYTSTITVVPVNSTKFDLTNSVFAITDLTTVIEEGLVTLVKSQAVDANCDTTFATPLYKQGETTAKPGECIYYRIVATNQSKSDATGVTIYDVVPPYTTYILASAKAYLDTTPATTGVSIATDNIKTKVSYNIGTTTKLAPTKTATLEFAVKVDGLSTP